MGAVVAIGGTAPARLDLPATWMARPPPALLAMAGSSQPQRPRPPHVTQWATSTCRLSRQERFHASRSIYVPPQLSPGPVVQGGRLDMSFRALVACGRLGICPGPRQGATLRHREAGTPCSRPTKRSSRQWVLASPSARRSRCSAPSTTWTRKSFEMLVQGSAESSERVRTVAATVIQQSTDAHDDS